MRCFMEIKLRSACMRKEATMVLLLPISHVDPHSDAEDHPPHSHKSKPAKFTFPHAES